MNNQPLLKHAVRIGVFAVILYILCLVWRVPLATTDQAVLTFHMTALRAVFPGFTGYDVLSVLWGGVLSFVYGFVASIVFHKLHEDCCIMKK
jgi:hypothetical protein